MMADEKGLQGSAIDAQRRTFLQQAGAAALGTAVAASFPAAAWSKAANGYAGGGLPAVDMDAITAEITKRHDESLKRMQDWIRQPSIAAENRGMNEGCELMMNMLKDAGFSGITK